MREDQCWSLSVDTFYSPHCPLDWVKGTMPLILNSPYTDLEIKLNKILRFSVCTSCIILCTALCVYHIWHHSYRAIFVWIIQSFFTLYTNSGFLAFGMSGMNLKCSSTEKHCALRSKNVEVIKGNFCICSRQCIIKIFRSHLIFPQLHPFTSEIIELQMFMFREFRKSWQNCWAVYTLQVLEKNLVIKRIATTHQ